MPGRWRATFARQMASALAFAMMANNFGTSPDIVERTMDAMVVRLAEFTRR